MMRAACTICKSWVAGCIDARAGRPCDLLASSDNDGAYAQALALCCA